MALLLLSGLQSNAYVLGAAPLVNAPARATFPVMADQKPVPYGQPTIAGMTVEMVWEKAAKAAKKDPEWDKTYKNDGKVSPFGGAKGSSGWMN